MSNEYGFFAAKNHDRRYSAEDLCALFRDFFTDGVYGKDTNGFAVTADGGMSISVGGGTAYIRGHWYRKSSSQVLEASCGNTAYGRYDGVVIRCDYEKREVYASVREGIPSETPEKPAPQRDESAYEIVLAYIYVGAGLAEITQADITDTRSDTSLCGWVTGVIDQIDTTALFAQYEAQWELLRAACEQDEAAVIAAWDSLNTVKKVNSVEPVNGNVSLVQGDIPSGKNAYQLPFLVQAGTVTKASPMTVTFPVAYKTAPVVVCTANLTEDSSTSLSGSGYYFKTKVTKTGFTLYSYSTSACDNINWVAFGEV